MFTDTFKDLPGVQIYINDVIVWGVDEKQHNDRLKVVFERAKSANVRFNQNNCKFGVPEVKYLGHIFTKDGLKPDGDKEKAILDMEIPKDKIQLPT